MKLFVFIFIRITTNFLFKLNYSYIDNALKPDAEEAIPLLCGKVFDVEIVSSKF
jgi:hypothetical protein